MKADHRHKPTYEDERQQAADMAKLNTNFYMLFKKTGSPVLRALIRKNASAGVIFLFLAEQADRTNAIVASGKALAAALDMSEATVSRAIKTLIDEGFIERINSGGTNVFILNPELVWSAWKTGKTHCLFGNAKVLVSLDEQDAPTRKRLNVLIGGGQIDTKTRPLFEQALDVGSEENEVTGVKAEIFIPEDQPVLPNSESTENVE